MNKLDFGIKAGWPGSTETFEWMQNMILQAQQGGQLGGRYFVINGCVESAGNISDGLVCIDGEILPFVGGPAQPKVIVVDTVTNREFFGGALNPYYHDRVATFGSGAGEVLWTDFKRNNPDNGVLARLDKVEKMLKPLMGYDVGGVTQYGSWLFWGRPASEIPEGWEAVPDVDWKGKVPVVMDAGDVDFNVVGKVGGEKKHTLTVNEMPSHGHKVYGDAATSGGGQPYGLNRNDVGITGAQRSATYIQSNTIGTKYIEESGGNQSHNNLQPYKVVMFIRFVG